MISNSQMIFVKRIELYENERYSPMSGWSTKGLLLTDRKGLSSQDGSDGFASIEEANNFLLTQGKNVSINKYYFKEISFHL